MNVTGEFRVEAPRDAVFDRLADPTFFASCFDGVSGLTDAGDGRYDALFETKVAYMTFRFTMKVEMVRLVRPEIIEARIEGAPTGIVGRLTATSLTRLAEDGAGTRIHYAIDSVLTGRLGSLGQPVLRAKARDMERQLVERLRAAFQVATPAEPA
ncbi:MAG: CoxG family protein [Vicinamibacterales bacterium]